jgi:hypothetical protein
LRKGPSILGRLRKGLCAWQDEGKGSLSGSLRRMPLLAVLGKDTLLDRLRKGLYTWKGEEKDTLSSTVCGGGHYLAVLGQDTILNMLRKGPSTWHG